MFDGLRDKWRKSREKKAALEAVNKAIPTDDPARVKKALEGLKNVELTYEDKSELVKTAINNLTVPVFKEVMDFVGDPNIEVKNTVRKGDNYVTYTYTPLGYSVMVKRTHDISLYLANEPRANVSGEIMDSARSGGMQDVALVLMQRIADLKRKEAAQLEKEAGQQPPAAVTDPAAVIPAPATPGVIEDSGETWALMAKNSVARVTSSPAIGRKLTEIFNFESSERVLITENLKTGAETIGNPEKFDTLAPATLHRAQAMLKALTADSPGKKFTL